PYATASLFCFRSLHIPPHSTLFPYTTLFRSVRRPSLRILRNPPQNDPPGVHRRALLLQSSALGRRYPRRSLRRGEYATNRRPFPDRKSTRLNSSHVKISYAVFCLKQKKLITK